MIVRSQGIDYKSLMLLFFGMIMCAPSVHAMRKHQSKKPAPCSSSSVAMSSSPGRASGATIAAAQLDYRVRLLACRDPRQRVADILTLLASANNKSNKVWLFNCADILEGELDDEKNLFFKALFEQFAAAARDGVCWFASLPVSWRSEIYIQYYAARRVIKEDRWGTSFPIEYQVLLSSGISREGCRARVKEWSDSFAAGKFLDLTIIDDDGTLDELKTCLVLDMVAEGSIISLTLDGGTSVLADNFIKSLKRHKNIFEFTVAQRAIAFALSGESDHPFLPRLLYSSIPEPAE